MGLVLFGGRGIVGRFPVEPPLGQRSPQRTDHLVVPLGFDPFGEDGGARSLDLLEGKVEDPHCLTARGTLSHLQVELDDVRPDYRKHGHRPDIRADIVQGQTGDGRPLPVDAFEQGTRIVV
jgi:hypothetical protein